KQDATQDDVKTAYRAAARRFHPDANPNPGAAIQFRDMAEAYETLGNPIIVGNMTRSASD
ncbi:J domain-containing protein, partial [Candidatus Gracilibacteria bacterium]|nr:J domain-containing protein [Candidatus Gracilibacteria bacterium]